MQLTFHGGVMSSLETLPPPDNCQSADKNATNICKYDHLEPEKNEPADTIPGFQPQVIDLHKNAT